jgi:hypothetical protein
MGFLRELAYGVYLGPLPIIAIVGLVTYTLVVTAAFLAWARRWSKTVRRVPMKFHRRMGLIAAAVATFHLLLGISIYV